MDEISDLPYESFDVERVAGSGPAGIDAILSEVLAQVDDVLHEQVRLRLLVDAVVSMNADVSLNSVLTGMAETAARLVDAKQAAIAVFTPGPQWRLRTFVQRGMSDGEAEALAGLSGETGLLDHLLEDGAAVRLRELLERAEAAGIAREQVPLASFLGVPVRTRTEVFGVLYLADRLADGDFTDQDESLMVALSTAAGVAIDNARLHAQASARQRWLAATAAVVSLLSDADGAAADDSTMAAVAEHARQASGADVAWIASGADVSSLRLHALLGNELSDPSLDPGAVDLSRSLVAEAVTTGAPVLVDDLAADARAAVHQPLVGRAMVVPLSTGAGVVGALGLGWHHHHADALDDTPAVSLNSMQAFTRQVAQAVGSALARGEGRRRALQEDRGRIGTDLHDLVVQRLFGVGIGLEAAARLVDRPAASARLTEAVDELDAAIADLRRSIFDLGSEPPAQERTSD